MYLQLFEKSLDFAFAKLPQKRPNYSALKNCKLVAHRGAFSKSRKENTLEAFEACRNSNIWGIEFDIRWTSDNVPIVFHDEHGGRVFDRPDIWISEVSFSRLRSDIPQIPTLEEVIHKFKDRLHFMIELKTLLSSYQRNVLNQTLNPIRPGTNFHILSLDPRYFEAIDLIPPTCFLPVAQINTRQMSQLALKKNWAGVAGHFCLVDDRIKMRHELQGQKVGVGYINSKNSLYREVNRGCEWLFSNNALEVAKFTDPLNL